MGVVVTMAQFISMFALVFYTRSNSFFTIKIRCNLTVNSNNTSQTLINTKMTRFILFIWALNTVPISAAPVTRSLDLNMSDDKSISTSLIEEVLAIAGSHDSAIEVAVLSAFIAVFSAILLACLMVTFYVKTAKKISDLAKLIERDNSINEDLESGLREERKSDEETVLSLSPTDFKPDENYHKQRELMFMKIKERQRTHPLTKMTSMDKCSQIKQRRRRLLRSRKERNKSTTLKVQSFSF